MSFGCLTDRRDIPEGIVMAAELPPGEAGDLEFRWPAFAAPPISTDSKASKPPLPHDIVRENRCSPVSPTNFPPEAWLREAVVVAGSHFSGWLPAPVSTGSATGRRERSGISPARDTGALNFEGEMALVVVGIGGEGIATIPAPVIAVATQAL